MRMRVLKSPCCERYEMDTSAPTFLRGARQLPRVRSKVLGPRPADRVPIATQDQVSVASMPVNLTVMDVVGRQEAPVFTWNPVEQMWVQERGGAAKPPPAPHDIHAIQTWFLDADENEWIQTVLGPMGRQLAAQWRGAHRVPDAAIARQTKGPQKRSPLLFIVAGVVLVALIGGVAVAAPGLMNPDATPAPSNPTVVTSGNTPAPVGTPTAGPAAEQTPDPTQ